MWRISAVNIFSYFGRQIPASFTTQTGILKTTCRPWRVAIGFVLNHFPNCFFRRRHTVYVSLLLEVVKS